MARAASNALYDEVQRVLAGIPIDFGGGCSVSKAHVMAWLIHRFRLRTTLDIGVYRGRSLFPQAIAHARYSGGVVYGVDPWCAEEAREHDHEELREELARFAETTDFEAIYQEVATFRRELDLANHCVLMRATSEQASMQFQQQAVLFDLIHIDGNHDTRVVMRDVELYRPLLAGNGFLVLDDVSWKSVRPAYWALREDVTLLLQRRDSQNDYAVFSNHGSRLDVAWLRVALAWHGRR
jgi:hypothetical protein